MKLYGLKDYQGRNVELTISDEGHPHHHVLKVDVLSDGYYVAVERECNNCQHILISPMDYPCALCHNNSMFEARKPAKD